MARDVAEPVAPIATPLAHQAILRSVPFASLLLGMFALTALTLSKGAVDQRIGANDVAINMQGAWKALHGFLPSRDYYCPLGPLFYLGLAAIMRFITGPHVNAMAWLQAIVAWLICLPLYWFARRRLASPYAELLTFYCASLVLTCYFVDSPFPQPSYCSFYNRDSYAVLILISVLCFVVSSSTRSAWQAFGIAALVGGLMVLVFLMKANYAVAAIVLVAAALPFAHRPMTSVLGGVVGGLSVLLVFVAATDISVQAYLKDVANASRIAQIDKWAFLIETFSPRWLLEEPVERRWRRLYDTPFLLVLGIACLPGRGRVEQLRLITMVAGIILAAHLTKVGSNFSAGMRTPSPMYVAAALILPGMSGLTGWEPRGQVERTFSGFRDFRPRAIILLCAAILIVSPIYGNLRAIAVACMLPLREPYNQAIFRIDSDRFGRICMIHDNDALFARDRDDKPTEDYAATVNDGLALLRQHARPGSIVEALSYSNPFPFALGLPPGKGSPTWCHPGYTYSETIHPEAGAVLGDAELVMVPRDRNANFMENRWSSRDNKMSGLLWSIYGGYVQGHFKKIDESKCWDLYERIPERAE